jgi:hypothetical protein
MFDASLLTAEVTRRVTYTVAAWFTVAELNWVRMRPTWGYISLVSMTTLPIFLCSLRAPSFVTDTVLSLGAGDGERF